MSRVWRFFRRPLRIGGDRVFAAPAVDAAARLDGHEERVPEKATAPLSFRQVGFFPPTPKDRKVLFSAARGIFQTYHNQLISFIYDGGRVNAPQGEIQQPKQQQREREEHEETHLRT